MMVERTQEQQKATKEKFLKAMTDFKEPISRYTEGSKQKAYLETLDSIMEKVDILYKMGQLHSETETSMLNQYLKEFIDLLEKVAPEMAKKSEASKETIIENFTKKYYNPIMESLGLAPEAAQHKTSAKKEEEAIDEPQPEKQPASMPLEENQKKVQEFVRVFIKICEKGNDEEKKKAAGIEANILQAAGMQALKDGEKEYNENALKDAINKAVEKAKTITTQNKGPEKNTVKGIMMEKLKNLAKSIVSPKQAKQDKENKKSFAELEKSFAELEKLRDTIDVNPMGRV